MKSFFVIRGKIDRWFDQQGKEMEMVDTGSGMVPYLKGAAESPIASNPDINDNSKVPTVYFGYHVLICETVEDMQLIANQQNII